MSVRLVTRRTGSQLSLTADAVQKRGVLKGPRQQDLTHEPLGITMGNEGDQARKYEKR